MKPFLAVAVISVSIALAVCAGAEDASDGSGEGFEREIYTAWGHDFELFMGTEGPVNPSTGARTCSAGPCGWAAGLHVPTGAQLISIALSACDANPTGEVSFTLLRGPNVPAASIPLLPFIHSGTAAVPGCTTFEAALPVPETVENKDFAYVFVVNSLPGVNVEWNQVRVTYRVQ